MSRPDYEKLGVFYLGRELDPQKPDPGPDLLYDSRDLTTHAVCIGMTGSGKTGLCVSLLEEAALDGVPAIVPEIRVEVLLEEGTRLIVLRDPFGPAGEADPGAIAFGEGDVPLVPGRERRAVTVTNVGERPIRVSSHFPFWRVNAHLSFDRDRARGFRLDLPAGDSIRWEPGQSRDVTLVAYAGALDA